MTSSRSLLLATAFSATALFTARSGAAPVFDTPGKDEHIVLLGDGLGEKLQYSGAFESELLLRFPEAHLTLRNMCTPGDTPVFRFFNGPQAQRPAGQAASAPAPATPAQP